MLFSEPKIPQSTPRAACAASERLSFSALQRAENSSIPHSLAAVTERWMFQCSSASRKFLNAAAPPSARSLAHSFSALQRAENSSIVASIGHNVCWYEFQCSSASRKFLNENLFRVEDVDYCGFSALQRAENSSIFRGWTRSFNCCKSFSALQRAENSSMVNRVPLAVIEHAFQCSSASRKFLNLART